MPMPKSRFKRLLPLVRKSAWGNLRVRALTEEVLLSDDELVTFITPTDSPTMPTLREGDAMLVFLVVGELRDEDEFVVLFVAVILRDGDEIVVFLVVGVETVVVVIFTVSVTLEVPR